MYQKITHTIVEEHFNHPIASQIKKKIERSRIPTNEIFLESKFQEDIQDYFSTYQTAITDMINSVTENEENLVTPFENMFKTNWIDRLGNMTKSFYPSNLGETINLSLRQLALLTFYTVQLSKFGKESEATVNSLRNTTADQLAKQMESFNYLWGYDVTRMMFIDIVDNILVQTNARLKKDSATDQIAKDDLARLFLRFEDFFVTGIPSQFPYRFTNSMVTATIENDRDIM
jgi:hypothetical protein